MHSTSARQDICKFHVLRPQMLLVAAITGTLILTVIYNKRQYYPPKQITQILTES